MEKELAAGATYDQLLVESYKNLNKTFVPKQQQDIALDDTTLQLQKNLTRNNLRMVGFSDGLINQIVQLIIDKDGDLINFNKYFNTFKSAVQGIKISNIDDFTKVWNQFKSQNLGTELRQEPDITVNTNNSITDMENMSSEELDKLFRAALEFKEGKKIDKITSIQYHLTSGELSQKLTLINKESIISFIPMPRDNYTKELLVRINNVKIRYIYSAFNPSSNMKNLRVKWNGPRFSNENSSQTDIKTYTDSGTPSYAYPYIAMLGPSQYVSLLEGSGLSKSFLKKKYRTMT